VDAATVVAAAVVVAVEHVISFTSADTNLAGHLSHCQQFNEFDV
jgi:hypothetical protein